VWERGHARYLIIQISHADKPALMVIRRMRDLAGFDKISQFFDNQREYTRM
jgi:hypothetical protein